MYIETTVKKPAGEKETDGSMEITGHLGEVMKESAKIALTVSRNFMRKIEPNNKFLDNAYVTYTYQLEYL